MTTIAICERAENESNASGKTTPRAGVSLQRLWQSIAIWGERRRMKRRLYAIKPRLLCDMGFEPAEVYDAYKGTIGEVPGDRFRGLGVARASCAKVGTGFAQITMRK